MSRSSSHPPWSFYSEIKVFLARFENSGPHYMICETITFGLMQLLRLVQPSHVSRRDALDWSDRGGLEAATARVSLLCSVTSFVCDRARHAAGYYLYTCRRIHILAAPIVCGNHSPCLPSFHSAPPSCSKWDLVSFHVRTKCGRRKGGFNKLFS